MKNVLHKEITKIWLSRWASIELLACLYIGHQEKERGILLSLKAVYAYVMERMESNDKKQSCMIYIGGELLVKLKLNPSLRCIEIRMRNVGVKNVSVESNIGNYF